MRDHRSDRTPPSPWVRRFIDGARHGGAMLDVACGSGRHVDLGLAQGLAVTGVDRSLDGVARFAGDPRVTLIEADLEAGGPLPFARDRFSAVIVTNYLWRPILDAVVAAVADEGILIYETFAVGNERLDRPSNPDFLLKPAELIGAVHRRLVPVAYEHVRLDAPARIVQRICAVGPQHPWLATGAPEALRD
jgi:SAM-dependent methyltransferase